MKVNLQSLPFEKENTKEGKNTQEKVNNTHTEELFFSICSPIGSLKNEAIIELKSQLNSIYKYDVEIIKLSDFIDEYKTEDFKAIPGKTEIFSQYNFSINQGNQLREKYNNQILSEFSIAKIYANRASKNNDHLIDANYKSIRKCYIFDSVKRKEELNLFRAVYTDNFYQISIFSPLDERIDNLITKGFAKNEAEEIISIDDYQNLESGQNVRGTFTDGDFFLRISKNNKKTVKERVERYLSLIFESKVITPTIEETSMYYAKSAANNSSCLSRQVGACIIDNNGNVLSTGWNDVPKFGGNLYKDESENDDRCFKNKKYCTNDLQKDILTDSISELFKSDEELKNFFYHDNIFNVKYFEKFKKKIRNSRVKDLIEFTRAVHAEMHAIILGSQLTGSQMINGKLFCTTYPCHNCARHIILAGIKEVYYIEPYVKSMCLKLHEDSVTENEKDVDKVKILIFDGVAPRRYQLFFTNIYERKEKNGKLAEKDLATITPKITKSLQALPHLERQAIISLKNYGLLEIE